MEKPKAEAQVPGGIAGGRERCALAGFGVSMSRAAAQREALGQELGSWRSGRAELVRHRRV